MVGKRQNSHVSESENTGQSRAAKKRAKKKQKGQKNSSNSETNLAVESTINDELHKSEKLTNKYTDKCEIPKSKKKGKEKANQSSIESQGLNNFENECKTEIDQQKEDEKEFDRFLSELSPSDILFPQDSEDHKPRSDVEDDMPDPRQIIQQVTAEKRSRILFNSLLAPCGIDADEFYKQYWEKEPLLITNPHIQDEDTSDIKKKECKKDNKDLIQSYQKRLDGFLSKKNIENLLKKYPMQYGKDLNVTKYCEDEYGEKRRITLDLLPDMKNNDGEDLEYVLAESNDVWSNFSDGCSVRLLCPHKYNDRIHALLSTLELEFGCMIGANAYLTPGPDKNNQSTHQGFAPHFDDIEAFILQLEGYKHWKVYPPLNKGEVLPRESSRDYTEKEIEDVEPVIDFILGPGDMLYMPRGWIHQASTPTLNEIKEMVQKSGKELPNQNHSLHLTVSAMQSWSWVDLLELIMPEALDAAAMSSTSTSLREGLPRNFLNYMGAIHDTSGEDSNELPEGLKQLVEAQKDDECENEEISEEDIEHKRRIRQIKLLQEKFKAEAKKKIMRVCKEAMSMLDAACDQIGKRFLSDRLPPYLMKDELAMTSDNRAENGGKIWPNTMIRLIRPNVARLVLEDGKAILYHCGDNSRVFHGNPLSPMEFEVDDAPAIEMILKTTEPHWLCVKDLIHGDIEDKMEIAQVLFDEGILAMMQSEMPDTSVQTG